MKYYNIQLLLKILQLNPWTACLKGISKFLFKTHSGEIQIVHGSLGTSQPYNWTELMWEKVLFFQSMHIYGESMAFLFFFLKVRQQHHFPQPPLYLGI